jgi:hypothetical protein
MADPRQLPESGYSSRQRLGETSEAMIDRLLTELQGTGACRVATLSLAEVTHLASTLRLSPQECEQEEVDAAGAREGNTCIAADPRELEFPDDWCWHCYVLKCVAEARDVLARGRKENTQ